MDYNQIVFDVHGFKPPKYPLPGCRRLVVLKNIDDSTKRNPSYFFSFTDCPISSLCEIYHIIKKSDFKDRESLRWHKKEGYRDDYLDFSDNREITESCMVEMCKAYNKSVFGIGKSYNCSSRSVHSKEYKLSQVRRWDGTDGIKHDLENLACDIGTSGFQGLESDLEEYIKQLDEKFDGIIMAIKEQLKIDPSTVKERW